MDIKWTVENTFRQMDVFMRQGNFQQARILFKQLIEYLETEIMKNPGLLSWLSTAGLGQRMATLGFTTAEIAAVTTVVMETEAATTTFGVTTVTTSAVSTGFFAQTIVVAGVTLTFLEVLAGAFIIAILAGFIFWVSGAILQEIIDTFPRVRQWLLGY